jgi:hypothetical protein
MTNKHIKPAVGLVDAGKAARAAGCGGVERLAGLSRSIGLTYFGREWPHREMGPNGLARDM